MTAHQETTEEETDEEIEETPTTGEDASCWGRETRADVDAEKYGKKKNRSCKGKSGKVVKHYAYA